MGLLTKIETHQMLSTPLHRTKTMQRLRITGGAEVINIAISAELFAWRKCLAPSIFGEGTELRLHDQRRSCAFEAVMRCDWY